MDLNNFLSVINSVVGENKKFLAVNFGCRVNAAELNQLSQIAVEMGFTPAAQENPDLIIVNTCSITKKGEIESLSKARSFHRQYPQAVILVTGCANLKKIEKIENIYIFDNNDKESILSASLCSYSSEIKDKFSHTHRFVLKVQSGCSQFCSYCIVPYRRQYLWSLNLDKAVKTVKKAVSEGYKEIIITGVNLEQYTFGLSTLVETLLSETEIELISFGSVPINTVDDKFIKLYSDPDYNKRLQHFLHIPVQSGSNKILDLMKRPYKKEKVTDIFSRLKRADNSLRFGTDIIVGFPGETEEDFQETFDLCQILGFEKIHTFRYSQRPNTLAKFYYNKYQKISREELARRSRLIRNAVVNK